MRAKLAIRYELNQRLINLHGLNRTDSNVGQVFALKRFQKGAQSRGRVEIVAVLPKMDPGQHNFGTTGGGQTFELLFNFLFGDGPARPARTWHNAVAAMAITT